MIWWWISQPHATFGVKAVDGVIMDAAPIARWTLGKPEHKVIMYYVNKGARVEMLDKRQTIT